MPNYYLTAVSSAVALHLLIFLIFHLSAFFLSIPAPYLGGARGTLVPQPMEKYITLYVTPPGPNQLFLDMQPYILCIVLEQQKLLFLELI